MPDDSIENAREMAICFICSGVEVAKYWDRTLQFALRKIANRNNIILGAFVYWQLPACTSRTTRWLQMHYPLGEYRQYARRIPQCAIFGRSVSH